MGPPLCLPLSTGGDTVEVLDARFRRRTDPSEALWRIREQDVRETLIYFANFSCSCSVSPCWYFIRFSAAEPQVNTHAVRGHEEAPACASKLQWMNDPLSFRIAQEFLSPVLVRLLPLNPQLQLREKRMINLKASPKGEGFSPIPRRRH